MKFDAFAEPLKRDASNVVWKDFTASLDRKDSTKGYELDNVQWIHEDLNRMKGNLPDFVFIQWCKRIAQYQEEKP